MWGGWNSAQDCDGHSEQSGARGRKPRSRSPSRSPAQRPHGEGVQRGGGGESMLRLFLMRRKAGRRDGGEIAITHVFFFDNKTELKVFSPEFIHCFGPALKGAPTGPLQLGFSSDRKG